MDTLIAVLAVVVGLVAGFLLGMRLGLRGEQIRRHDLEDRLTDAQTTLAQKEAQVLDLVRDKAALDAAFAAAGLDPEKATIASCGSGMPACILSLALAASGRAPATVYDGSWSEWGGRADLPTVSYTGAAA